MTEVYVAMGHWDYEGSSLLGVFSTREAATAKAESERGNWDQTTVSMRKIDDNTGAVELLATFDHEWDPYEE